MALPEQFADRLNREQIEAPGWSGQLLMFSGTVFFISLAVYFGLILGYKPYLDGQVASLDSQIKSFDTQIPQDEQGKLISFYSQVINLQNILNSHVVSSKLFAWLEKNTSNNVYYNKLSMTDFSGTANYVQLNIGGFSKTPDDFSKQMVAFQNDPLVQRMTINNFSAPSGSNQWHFEVTLFLSNDIVSQSSSTSG
ncbi:MAG TPA: hypothetical protein VMV71_03685 [Candidatus Paceibacterota bacterium]|nr:hypothetical protein [Candidatus Paceibacterota bacterium]